MDPISSQIKLGLALLPLLLCMGGPLGHATTIDQNPRPTIFLTKLGQFIAQDTMDSVSLYDFKNPENVRRFPSGGRINDIDVTTDEQFLLVACANGEIGVWNIHSGLKLWWQNSTQNGFKGIYGASFSLNGRSVVVYGWGSFPVVILDALTGHKIGTIKLEENAYFISGALSPDGGKGILLDLLEQLFIFDTSTGFIKDTGLKGWRPIRYSSDGNYIVMPVIKPNLRGKRQLRIVSAKDFSSKDVGRYYSIDQIEPTEDRGFRFCAGRGINEQGDSELLGMEYHPASDELKEIWKLQSKDIGVITAFDPKRMIGVFTNYRLVTWLIDLKTGKVIRTIDNSPNYQPIIVSRTVMGKQPPAEIPPTVWDGPYFRISCLLLLIILLGLVVAKFLKYPRNKSILWLKKEKGPV